LIAIDSRPQESVRIHYPCRHHMLAEGPVMRG